MNTFPATLLISSSNFYEDNRIHAHNTVACLHVAYSTYLDWLCPSDLLICEPCGKFGCPLQSSLGLCHALCQFLLLTDTTLIACLKIFDLTLITDIVSIHRLYAVGKYDRVHATTDTFASMFASLFCFSFSCAITTSSSCWAALSLQSAGTCVNCKTGTATYIQAIIVLPFPLWFNSLEHFGIQIQCTNPQTHGLACFWCLLNNFRLELWIIDVLLQFLQSGFWNIVLWVSVQCYKLHDFFVSVAEHHNELS